MGTGIFFAGYYETNTRKITLFPSAQDSYLNAGIIIHEVCHAYQQNLSRELSEPDCALTQYNFLTSIDTPKEDIDKFNSALSFFENYKFTKSNLDYFALWKNTMLTPIPIIN